MPIADILSALVLGDANQAAGMPAQAAPSQAVNSAVPGILDKLAQLYSGAANTSTSAAQNAVYGINQPNTQVVAEPATTGAPMGFGSADATPPQAAAQAPAQNNVATAQPAPAQNPQ